MQPLVPQSGTRSNRAGFEHIPSSAHRAEQNWNLAPAMLYVDNRRLAEGSLSRRRP
jgi:hypothetical protein